MQTTPPPVYDSKESFGMQKWFRNLYNDLITLFSNVTTLQNAYPALSSTFKASLGADVLLNNTANYFDGPSVAQGSTGTWYVSGTVTLSGNAADAFNVKLWDGTTIIASTQLTSPTGNLVCSASVSGIITSPAGNLKISCRDISSTAGRIFANNTGNGKDSTITAIRIA